MRSRVLNDSARPLYYTIICWPQRNYYLYKNGLQNTKTNCSLTQWWHRLLQHCCSSLAKRYKSVIICPDYLLRTSIDLIQVHDFNWSDTSTWFPTKKARTIRYPIETLTDADHADNLPFLHVYQTKPNPNINQGQASGGYVKTNESEFMCLKQEGVIFIPRDNP